jgi:hypothetical protein
MGAVAWSEPHVVAALKDKRAELAGIIGELEKRIDGHRADLVHLDATLRMFAPDIEVARIRPRAVHRRNAWFGRGECARLVYGILRTAVRPMTSREIAEALMADRGLDPADRRTRELIQKTVHGMLKHAEPSVVAAPADGQALAWRVAD